MRVDGRQHRTLRSIDDGSIEIIDQARLPHEFLLLRLTTLAEVARAITSMQVRGAPLIGVTAAWGVALALRADPSDRSLSGALEILGATRPTAVNLAWALARMRRGLEHVSPRDRWEKARELASAITEEDAAMCRRIGEHGAAHLKTAWDGLGHAGRVNVLTHCNAGWLATVDYGTALAPIYAAHEAGIPIHVWVDETRPRNQGLLTAWELRAHGIPHTLVADNAGGLLMRRGEVDLCLVGADRVARNGDACNKIGTYLKALAARDNGVPFYVVFPSSTLDWAISGGDEIPIEDRGADEVRFVRGLDGAGRSATVRIAPESTPVANPAFDVTPARLITGLVTERGRCAATFDGLLDLYPEHAT